jgi:hypothetical protein
MIGLGTSPRADNPVFSNKEALPVLGRASLFVYIEMERKLCHYPFNPSTKSQ